MIVCLNSELPVKTRSRPFKIELLRLTVTHKWIMRNIVMFITMLWTSSGSSKRLENLWTKKLHRVFDILIKIIIESHFKYNFYENLFLSLQRKNENENENNNNKKRTEIYTKNAFHFFTLTTKKERAPGEILCVLCIQYWRHARSNLCLNDEKVFNSVYKCTL